MHGHLNVKFVRQLFVNVQYSNYQPMFFTESDGRFTHFNVSNENSKYRRTKDHPIDAGGCSYFVLRITVGIITSMR